MNQITTASTTAVADPSANPFLDYAKAVQSRSIVGDLLKFSKGEFTTGLGDSEKVLDEGTEFIAAMGELMVGWVRWEDGKPTDQIIGRVLDGFTPPKRAELGDDDKSHWETDNQGQARDPWQLTNYLILLGSDGKLYTFATASRGGLGAIGALCETYGKAMRAKPDEYPVIALRTDSYRHKDKALGKIFVPKFEVVRWAKKAAVTQALAGAAEDAEAEQTAKAEPEAKHPAKSPPAKSAPLF